MNTLVLSTPSRRCASTSTAADLRNGFPGAGCNPAISPEPQLATDRGAARRAPTRDGISVIRLIGALCILLTIPPVGARAPTILPAPTALGVLDADLDRRTACHGPHIELGVGVGCDFSGFFTESATTTRSRHGARASEPRR